MSALLSLAAVPLVTTGCSQGDRAGSSDSSWLSGAGAGDGSISFELTAPPGVTFTTFTYAVVGPDFSKAGAIDVSKSATLSAIIDDLPPGPGYTITLLGTSAPPNAANCSGSAPFSVSAGQLTDVSVSLACRLQQTVPPPAVPVPPYAPVALGFVLLGLGTLAIRRRQAA